MIHLRSFVRGLWLAVFALSHQVFGADLAAAAPVHVGILGLDNYQGLAYAELFNNPKGEGDLAGVQVVAAYPIGSDDYPESAALVARWKETFARFGAASEKGPMKDFHPVIMVDSVADLLARCDAVMIMSL